MGSVACFSRVASQSIERTRKRQALSDISPNRADRTQAFDIFAGRWSGNAGETGVETAEETQKLLGRHAQIGDKRFEFR
jgi:hypothetical protein